MRPEVLCGLLAEDERLRAFAAVVLGAATPSAVAEQARLNARDAVRALRRLEQGGLVSSAGGTLVADVTAFKESVREYAPQRALGGHAQSGLPVPDEPLDPDQQKAAVLRAFIRDGRLVGIPVTRSKRLVVLEHLAAAFEPGQRYPERTVNAILRAWHDDYASLRRYLIDEELLSRENGEYWRTGGYVDVA